MLEIYLPIVQVNIDIFLLLFLSLVVGVLSGLFGVGGGFLMTPFLIFMGIPPIYAVPNEVNNILATSVSGSLTHWFKDTLDYKMGLMIVAGGVLGTLLGISTFSYFEGIGKISVIISLLYMYLLAIVGTLMLIEVVRAATQKQSGKKKLHEHNWLQGLPLRMRFQKSRLYESALTPILLGLIVGFVAAMMGIGGAFLMVPAMIYLIGMPTKLIPGTSLFVTIFITAFVVVGHSLQFESIDIYLVSFLLFGSIIGLHLGLKVAEKLNASEYKALLSLLLIVFAIFIGIETFVLNSSANILLTQPSGEISDLSFLIKKLAKNSPFAYASLSLFFVVFVGFIFSYIRELIHHFRYSKKENIKN
ncbi:MAG: sulfite exporter TauE/SafE family protein [Flavobacteriaceae bacterium]|nr:sulfite exporter TauE/SafE family protein [Flavobacteriaceae bacterium]